MSQRKTKVIVHLDDPKAPPPYLRGEGGDLSWEKGIELSPLNEGDWIWESHELLSEGAFKILLGDKLYELGEKHSLIPGSSVRVNPKFPPMP